jgi:hypothetical protein
MSKKLTVAALADLIKANPTAVFTVDNDAWWMERESAENNPHDEDDWEAFEAWEEANRICCDSDMGYTDNGYGSGNCYGGDILQALALIVGVKVESV